MAPNPNTSAQVAARMPVLREDQGADDAADEVDPAEQQVGERDETPEPPVPARNWLGTKNFQSAPTLPIGRSISMPLPLEDEGDEAEPPPSPPRKMDSYSLMIKLQRTKSDSELAAESAMAKIMALKAGIQEMDDRANQTLNSCQSIMDACGDAIAAWFKGLSGAALLRAIKEAFDKFDTDGSGQLDREEFAKAMHRLGLRLTVAEYDVLFDENDEDGSGEIDLDEFTHMVKKYLKLPDDALLDAGSQYQKNWADDTSLHQPAAADIQRFVRSSLAREEIFEGLTDNRTFEELRKRKMYRQNWDEERAVSHRNEHVPEGRQMDGYDGIAAADESGRGSEIAGGTGDVILSTAARKTWADDEKLFGPAASDLQRNARSSLAREEVFQGLSGNRTFAEMAKRNQYRQNWADDETLLHPAAVVLQQHVRSSLERANSGDYSCGDLESFARLSSAPGESSHPPLLSQDETRRNRRFLDDSGVGLFSRMRPMTSESDGYRKGARAQIWAKLKMQWEAEEVRVGPRVRPNKNLNHDADQFIFRGGMRIFLSHLPTGKEMFDHDFFQRCRSEPVTGKAQNSAIVGMIDAWPGQLPPLRQDSFVARESIRLHDAFPGESAARWDEDYKNLPLPSPWKQNKRDLRSPFDSSFFADEGGREGYSLLRSDSCDPPVYKKRLATQGQRSHPQVVKEGEPSTGVVPSRGIARGGVDSGQVHSRSGNAIFVTSIRDDIARAQHEYSLLSAAQRRSPVAVKSASSIQSVLPKLRTSRQGIGHALLSPQKTAGQQGLASMTRFRLTSGEFEILDLRG